jgi:hemerythrin-like metal-binding protein
MPLIIWDDAYSVHIIEIDQQHQQLVHLINKLHEAMLEGKSKETLQHIFDSLVSYTVTHFTTEEALMLTYGYPELREHKRQHDDFVAKVSELQKQFQSGKYGIGTQTRDFLKSWLLTHIKGTDQKYSAFLRKKGVR